MINHYCRDCFFAREISFYQGIYYECRHKSPTPGPKDSNNLHQALWPVVRATDGCGQFEKRPTFDLNQKED